ncbi:MAG: CocE/NonD family hydrolase, partial [Acidobacteriota bacterium]
AYAQGYVHRNPDPWRFFLSVGAVSNINRDIFRGEIPFWNDMSAHGTYDGFWKSRSVPQHMTHVKPAVMVVGGLFDAEDFYGPLAIYHAIEEKNPGASNMLVVGPWFHGGWARSSGEELGNIGFGSKTSDYYRDSIEAVFFRSYLKENVAPGLPEALVFQTGSNVWKRYDAWPPANLEPKKLFFHAGGKLSFLPPEASEPAFDEYVSDPSKPVPYTQEIHTNRNREFMTEDQRFAFYRPDVCSYESRALDEDLTVSGPVTVDLSVSTSGSDADFIVKVIDVLPDDTPEMPRRQKHLPMGGYQFPVRMDIMRGKFRNSYEKPEAFAPGEATHVRFRLNDINHRFLKGHRIMVQVQSSWFPLVDRNPQKFVDIYHASDGDYEKAIHRIYHAPGKASSIEIGIAR